MNVMQKVTWKTLKKNRTRTLVTVLGVILSAAMVTAVAASGASLRNLLIETIRFQTGDWHVAVEGIEPEQAEEIRQSQQVEGTAWAEELGFARCEEVPFEENKVYYTRYPYLYAVAMGEGFEDRMPLPLTSGQYPENSTELLLPTRFEKDYQPGDTIQLELGTRMLGEQPLGQFDLIRPEETLAEKHTETYTVCGFYNNAFYDQDGTGQFGMVLTRADAASAGHDQTLYLKLRDPKAYLNGTTPPDVLGNTALLRISGVMSGNALATVNGLLLIVVLLIVSVSVGLIYNAFSISVSERIKQFGLLSSVGATRRQLHRMVLFEALVIAGLGIPLGVLSGVAGLGITFRLLDKRIVDALTQGMGEGIHLKLCLPLPALAVVVLISLATVLLAAQIPARRATRVSAMEAIRRPDEMDKTTCPVRVSPVIRRMFGLPGLLAEKYFKQSRRKYRTTIFSLAMSIVLFITAWSLTDRAMEILEISYSRQDYQLEYVMGYGRTDKIDAGELLQKIKQLPSVESACYQYDSSHKIVTKQRGEESVWVNLIARSEWDALLEKYHLDPEIYNDMANPVAIAVDGKTFRNPETGKWDVCHMLQEETLEGTIATYGFPLKVGTMIREVPYYINLGPVTEPGYGIVYPEEVMDVLPGLAAPFPHYYIQSGEPDEAEKELTELFRQVGQGDEAQWIQNLVKRHQRQDGILLVMRVFAAGFITLLSLIAGANVFNTISTNLQLRSRDFAMLQTVGMSQKEIRRMLAFECLLYGVRSLGWGLLGSLGTVIWVSLTVGETLTTRIDIPWTAVLLAAAAVFAVVFAGMTYAMHKLKDKNLMDTLKNENL